MDDLSAKISEILGSEEGMKQFEEMARMLGVDPTQARQTADMIKERETSPPPMPDGGIDMMAVMRILQQMNRQDRNTALLDALKPYMSKQRVQKIENAKKIMNLMQLLPMLGKMSSQ